MPKVGKHYDIPTKDLDYCIDGLAKAHDRTKELSIKRDSFAKTLDLKPTGGGFGLIVGSLSMYGLVTTGDGYLRYTDTVKKILFGLEKEKIDFKNKAIRNIQLFADIFDRYGANPTEEQLRHFLRDRADVAEDKEAETAQNVRKLFIKNAKHLKPIGGESSNLSSATTQEMLGDVIFTVTAPNLRIDVDSPLKIALVKTMLADAEQRLGINKSAKNSSNHTEGEKDSDETT